VGEKVAMNPRTTIVAAILLATLGAYIYFYEREPVEDTDSELERAFEVEPDSLREIEIRRLEEDDLKVTKDNDSWRILEPVEAPADSTEVESLARNIAELERGRYVAEGEDIDLGEFGLADPELRIRFKAEGDETATGLLVGDETPTGTNRYAKLAAENKVFVISSYLKDNFEKTAWDLRDKKVLHFATDDVARISLNGPDNEVTLAKENEDLWNVTTPSLCRADRYKASSLVSRFETAKMEEIVSESADDLGTYGLDPATYEVSIELAEGGAAHLQIGDENNGKYYARDTGRPLVFLVASSIVDDIKKDPSEYRSKRLFEYATYQVTKFQIASLEGPDRVYVKQQEEENEDQEAQWVETSPESREWDRSKVEDLLYKINGTDAEDFMDPTPTQDLASFGLDQPAYVVTVWSKEVATVEEVAIGKPDGDYIYAHRKGDDPLLKIEASKWEEIEKLMDFSKEEPEEEKEQAPQ
jgi:hypothetical protein